MEFLVREYVDNLTEDNIKKYALKKGIKTTDDEIKIIYLYIKNYWRVFLKGDSKELFDELKEKLQPNTYNILLNLFNEYKSKI